MANLIARIAVLLVLAAAGMVQENGFWGERQQEAF